MKSLDESKFRKIPISAAFIFMVLMLEACSFKAPSSNLIQIRIPQNQPQSSIASSRATAGGTAVASTGSTSNPVPQSWSDFTCFAVNIRGAGIPNNPNVNCTPGTPAPALLAGTVAPGSTLTVSVPNGPARTVELIGFEPPTGSGCPDLQTVLNAVAAGANTQMNLGTPYLLGSTTLDIVSDASVTITGSYDPTHPTEAFPSCGVGNEGPPIAPVAAYQGYISLPSGTSVPVGPVPNLQPITQPSSEPGANEISGTAISSLSGLPLRTNGMSSAIPLNQGLSAITSSEGQRAVIQFQWDLSAIDLNIYPYGSLDLQIRGGAADSCASSQLFSASAGIWWPNNGANGAWVAVDELQQSAMGSQWSGQNAVLNVPLAQLAVAKGTGKYLIVNVESNYFGTSSCASSVYVANASLTPLKTRSAKQSGGPLYLGSNAAAGTPASGSTSSGKTYVAVSGQTVSFFANGGTPPYTFSAVSGAASVDSATGVMTAPTTAGTYQIQVTDSIAGSQPVSVTLTVVSSTSLGGLVLSSGSSSSGTPDTDGLYAAGSCVPMNFQIFSANGTSASTGLTVNGLSLIPPLQSTLIGAGAPSFYTDNACTSTSSTSVSQPGPLYVKPTEAGVNRMNASLGGNGASPAFSSEAAIVRVKPGTFSSIKILGPELVTIGACVPFLIQTSDQFGNPVDPATAQAVTMNFSSVAGGSVYASPACSGATLTSLSIPSGTAPAQAPFYFLQDGSNSTISISGSGVTPSGVIVLSPTVSAVTTGQPVQISLAESVSADTQGCAEITLTTVDSKGNPQSPTTAQVGPSVFFMSTSGNEVATFADQASCDSNSSSPSSVTIPANTSSTSIWVRTFSGDQIQTQPMVSSGVVQLMASSWLTIN